MKDLMKKTIVLVLITSICLSILTGCEISIQSTNGTSPERTSAGKESSDIPDSSGTTANVPEIYETTGTTTTPPRSNPSEPVLESFVTSQGTTAAPAPNVTTSTPSETPDLVEKPASVGLKYLLSNNEKYYIVDGIGTCMDSDIVVPSIYNEKPVRTIADQAFFYCKQLESITLPSSVTSIGNNAFDGCSNLESVIIPNSVKSIGSACFDGCSSLTSITLPQGLNTIDHNVFADCKNLASITIPNTVKTIGQWAFGHCSSLTSITIPNSVTKIDYGVFSGCDGLESLVIESGNSVYYSVGNCIIEKANKALIAGCKNSVIPSDGSVTRIQAYAFYDIGSLENITIPSTIRKIGIGAFSLCNSLERITLPSSITSIGDEAFTGCSSLVSIEVDTGNEAYYDAGNCLIEKESKTLIAGCQNSIIPINGSVKNIGNGAFRNCTGLESITIPEGVVSIGYGAFDSCDNLKSIALPNSVTGIGDMAFFGCSSLMSLMIPSSVSSIGTYAFFSCNIFMRITFEETTGWVVDNIAMNSTELSNPRTAAYYLIENYCYSTWTRTD